MLIFVFPKLKSIPHILILWALSSSEPLINNNPDQFVDPDFLIVLAPLPIEVRPDDKKHVTKSQPLNLEIDLIFASVTHCVKH